MKIGKSVLAFIQALVFTGTNSMNLACGDEEVTSPSPEDSDDESDNSEKPSGLHCPGELDESNDEWYCVIPTGTYTAENVAAPEALEWNTDLTYVLNGKVFIGDGQNETVLTIMPGTLVLGNPVTELDNTASLIIRQHSRIEAEGTPEAPIVFSSANPVGDRRNDDWGGLVINGLAPINICNKQPCEAEGEGETGAFGGEDPNDNSGTLAYVRIEFSGKRLTATVEFNGLTLQGVGRGTKMHHIHIHRPGDDGIEFFGGTAEVKYLLISGTGDDFFDWTHGWSGKAQFVAVQTVDGGLAADMGIEADNLEGDFDATPRANPTLYNFTLPRTMLLRRGTAGTFVNMYLTGLDIDDESTWNQVDSGDLRITHSVVQDSSSAFSDDKAELYVRNESEQWPLWEGNRVLNEQEVLLTAQNLANGIWGYMPESDSLLLSGGGSPPEGDDFFEEADFVGAFGTLDWTEGWTEYPEN